MNPSIIELIGVFLSGVLLQAILTYILGRRKESRSDFELIVQIWAEDNKRLREVEKERAEKIQQLEHQVAKLQSKILLLESAHYDLPIPMWLKDTDGTMLAINRAYERTFLIPNGFRADDYIGKKDHDVWPSDIADVYSRNDKFVLNTGQTLIENEPVLNSQDKWTVIKFVRFAGDTKIGVGGLAVNHKLI